MGRADNVARTLLLLCSEDASFISGWDIRVDGGLIASLGGP